MSHKERFTVWSNGITYFAPSTIGCPSMTLLVDRSVFKKSMDEKAKLYNLKQQVPKTKNHKFSIFLKAAF